MTAIYLKEYICRRYAIPFENDGCVRVQKFEDISDYEKNILCEKPLRTILGESEICEMIKISGAYDLKVFQGNNILLKISDENDKQRWVNVGCDKVCSFLTNGDMYKYTTKMGNSLTPYRIAIGSEDLYSVTPDFKFFKREMIKNDELLNTNEQSVDPYALRFSRCGKRIV